MKKKRTKRGLENVYITQRFGRGSWFAYELTELKVFEYPAPLTARNTTLWREVVILECKEICGLSDARIPCGVARLQQDHQVRGHRRDHLEDNAMRLWSSQGWKDALGCSMNCWVDGPRRVWWSREGRRPEPWIGSACGPVGRRNRGAEDQVDRFIKLCRYIKETGMIKVRLTSSRAAGGKLDDSFVLTATPTLSAFAKKKFILLRTIYA